MAIRIARQLLGLVFFQRCFYLFVLLLAFDLVAPFIDPGPHGKFIIARLAGVYPPMPKDEEKRAS